MAQDVAGGSLGFSKVLAEIPEPGPGQGQDGARAGRASSAGASSAASRRTSAAGGDPAPARGPTP
eukprot:2706005-Lingulodinium_polyedra.AAC.1